jgi:hypothetical protein
LAEARGPQGPDEVTATADSEHKRSVGVGEKLV